MIYAVVLGLAIIAGSVLKNFWWGVGIGVAIDAALFLTTRYGATLKSWIPKRSPSSAGTAHAAPSPSSHGAKSSGIDWEKWFKRVIIFGLIGWCWYSIENETGFPGNWVAKKNFVQTMDVSIADLKDKKVCGLPPSTRMSFEPVNPVIVHYGRPNEGFMPIDITSAMRVRGVGSHHDTTPGEAFTTDPQGCVVVTLDIRESFRKEAVLDRVDQVMAKHPRGVQLRFRRW